MGRFEAEPADGSGDMPVATTHAARLAAQAEAVAKRNATTADGLRKRAEIWGKALAGALSVALGWVSISKATDIFPGSDGDSRPLAVLCLILMTVSIALVWWWYNRQTRPLAMGLSIRRMRRTSPPMISFWEAQEVARLYGDLGQLNDPDASREEVRDALTGARNYDDEEASILIEKYAYQAIEKERQVEQSVLVGAAADAALDRAAQIRAEVYATQQRAMVSIIRRRVSGLTSGLVSSLAVLIFVGGFVGLSYAIDEIDAQRSAQTAQLGLMQKCAETIKNLQEQDIELGSQNGQAKLPGECGLWMLSRDETRVSVDEVVKLSDALAKCRSGAPAGQPDLACGTVAGLLEKRVNELTAQPGG